MIERSAKYLTFVVLALSSTARGDEARVETFQQRLAEKFYADGYDQTKERFKSIGLAPSDIDAAIRKLIDGYTACLVNGLRAQANEQSISFFDTMDEMESDMEAGKRFRFSSEIDAVALGEKIKPCKYEIDQEVGLDLR